MIKQAPAPATQTTLKDDEEMTNNASTATWHVMNAS